MRRNLTTRSADEQVLAMLDLRDHQNMSASAIAERFGLSKGMVSGAMHRVLVTAGDACACRKPENMDGGMPRRWWKS